MKNGSLSVLLGGLLATAGCLQASGATHWSYAGEEGPANWATLSPEFGACGGKNQSPVNLTGFIESELEPIDISYQPGGNEILNNGHTVHAPPEQPSGATRQCAGDPEVSETLPAAADRGREGEVTRKPRVRLRKAARTLPVRPSKGWTPLTLE